LLKQPKRAPLSVRDSTRWRLQPAAKICPLPQVTQPRKTEASDAARQRPLSIAKLTALGFVTGGVIHAAAFLLLRGGIQLYGPAYPGWRHVVMATVDGAIAWVALKWPRGLFVALPAWIAEQGWSTDSAPSLLWSPLPWQVSHGSGGGVPASQADALSNPRSHDLCWFSIAKR